MQVRDQAMSSPRSAKYVLVHVILFSLQTLTYYGIHKTFSVPELWCEIVVNSAQPDEMTPKSTMLFD